MSTSRRQRASYNNPRVAQQQPQQQPHPPPSGPYQAGHGGIASGGAGRRGRAGSLSTTAAAAAATVPQPSTGDGAGAHGGTVANISAAQDATDDLSTMGDDWLASFGLDPHVPVAVIGFFGRSRDMSTVERIRRVRPPKGHQGDGVPQDGSLSGPDPAFSIGVGDSKAVGDIRLYVDRSANTLLLHHDFACNDTDMLARLLPASMDILSSTSSNKQQSSQQTSQASSQQQQQQQPQQAPPQQPQQPHQQDTSLLWMKWMHRQEFASHRALLFMFLVSHVVVWTMPDMAVDMKTVSILTTLGQLKRHMMYELDKFMAVCWERLGFRPPPTGYYSPPAHPSSSSQQHYPYNSSHHQHQHHGHHQAPHGQQQHQHHSQQRQAGASSLLPGTCVPTLLFVVERLQLSDPWYDGSSSEESIREGLKALLKSSADRLQSRVKCVFQASQLIPAQDQQNTTPDTRQLFVLPNTSNASFAHIIPYFSVHFDLQANTEEHSAATENNVLTAASNTIQSQWRVPLQQPAEDWNRKGHGSSGSYTKKQPSSSSSVGAAKADPETTKVRSNESDGLVASSGYQPSSMEATSSASLLDLYSALTAETCDPILVATTTTTATATPIAARQPNGAARPPSFERSTSSDSTHSEGGAVEAVATVPASNAASVGQKPLTLATLYYEHSGMRLRRFIYDRIKQLQSSTGSSAGHGGRSAMGGRRGGGGSGASGSAALPPLKQWIAGSFAIREGLGIAPLPRSHQGLRFEQAQQQQQQRHQQQQQQPQEDQEEEDGDEEEEEGANGPGEAGTGIGGQGPGGSRATDQGQGPAADAAGRPGRSRRGGANRRGGKKLATKTANLVQKRIHDFVKVDEVMHELYGSRSEQAKVSRSAHSERYHQLKGENQPDA
ncbi:hypothetical protein BGZ73_006583 [Actinomortierella ambigua]|nr:hypothetical protein BGZ73_006583 [Actinomortierella ambigua]